MASNFFTKLIIGLVIAFFLIIIVHNLLFNYGFFNENIEGFEETNNNENNNNYKPYDTSNPNSVMILAQQNAGNIEYIKNRLDDYDGMNSKVSDLNSRVDSLTDQVNGLMTAQQQYVTEMAGDKAPEISGADIDENYSDEVQNVTIEEDEEE